MHRLERRSLAMRRIPAAPRLLAARTGSLSTASFDAFNALNPGLSHTLIRAYVKSNVNAGVIDPLRLPEAEGRRLVTELWNVWAGAQADVRG
jgi:hypothetical protein